MNFCKAFKDFMFGGYVEDDYEEEDGNLEEENLDVFQPNPEVANIAQVKSRQNASYNDNDKDSQIYSIHTSVQMQVVVVKPEGYEDSQRICEEVRSRKPVVVNFEKVKQPVAQRIMDFVSGSCYSLNGDIQRVANNIFIIAPENVDITMGMKEELKSKGVGGFSWAANSEK